MVTRDDFVFTLRLCPRLREYERRTCLSLFPYYNVCAGVEKHLVTRIEMC